MSQPGNAEYYQSRQEFTPPVLFTSLAPYPPPYMYQPMAIQLATHARQTSFYFYVHPPGTVVGPTVCNTPLVFGRPPNEVPQLVNTPQYYYSQPSGCAPATTRAPVGPLPPNVPKASFQGLGPWEESQNASHKPVLTGAHGLPSPGTTPMLREQILHSEKQCRLRKSKRTEHVMWVGNISPTATMDELYHFFRQVDSECLAPSESAVVSIHIPPKTRCALVNYKTEAALLDSIRRFHGMRLHNYPHAPRLACRRKPQSLTLLLSNLGGTNE